jgi:hypothetical protein
MDTAVKGENVKQVDAPAAKRVWRRTLLLSLGPSC